MTQATFLLFFVRPWPNCPMPLAPGLLLLEGLVGRGLVLTDELD